MDIDAWILLWKIVLIGGVVLFALLATCVTIGGFLDVKRLLAFLRQQHFEQEAALAAEENRQDTHETG